MAASSPTPEQWTAISKLVHSFYSKADAEPFREPVDYEGLGLFDYPHVIKSPMDLGTIKKKLAEKKYATLFQVSDDVRLVWNNCMTYNADGSDFFVLAQNLKKEWERRFSKLLQDHSVSATSAAAAAGPAMGGADAGAGTAADAAAAAKITVDEKRAFARHLYKISKEDLGKLLVEIDNKCQVALSRNNAEDEFELNVDKIPPNLFVEFAKYVQNCVSSGATGDKKSGGGSKKKGGGGGGASAATGQSAKRQKA